MYTVKISPDSESPCSVPIIIVLNFGPYAPCILGVKVVFESKYVSNLKLSIERIGSSFINSRVDRLIQSNAFDKSIPSISNVVWYLLAAAVSHLCDQMVSLILLFLLLPDCDCDKNAFSVGYMRSSNIFDRIFLCAVNNVIGLVLAIVLSLFGLFSAINIPSVMASRWVFVSNILLNWFAYMVGS